MSSDPSHLPLVDLKAQQARLGGALHNAINQVLEHGQFIMGPEVQQLEERLQAYTGAAHAISCSSGTDALLLTLMAHSIGPGDAVVCPAFTFCATAETVAMLGATPVFADIEPNSFNIDPSSARSALAKVRQAGLNAKAIIAVDLFGLPADYEQFDALIAEEARSGQALTLICDAAQSFGASVGDRKVGRFGAATALSFFPSKTLGCYGDGGAVLTDDSALADRMRRLRVHGKGKHKYDNVMIGLSARLDTLQAAILLAKLDVFDEELQQRSDVAERYAQGLSPSVAVPRAPQTVRHAWAQFTLTLPPGMRDDVQRSLSDAGIATAVYYPTPLHLMPAYREFPRASEQLQQSERLAACVLSVPMHPYLKMSDQERVIHALNGTLD